MKMECNEIKPIVCRFTVNDLWGKVNPEKEHSLTGDILCNSINPGPSFQLWTCFSPTNNESPKSLKPRKNAFLRRFTSYYIVYGAISFFSFPLFPFFIIISLHLWVFSLFFPPPNLPRAMAFSMINAAVLLPDKKCTAQSEYEACLT